MHLHVPAYASPMGQPYGQDCGVALGAEVFAERWTPLIVRELMLGPLRFTDLLARLPGVSTNLLTQRLRYLTTTRVVARGASARAVYRLTETGHGLEDTLVALGLWGLRLPRRPADVAAGEPVLAALLLRRATQLRARGDGTRFRLELGDRAVSITDTSNGVIVSRDLCGSWDASLVLPRDQVRPWLVGAASTSPWISGGQSPARRLVEIVSAAVPLGVTATAAAPRSEAGRAGRVGNPD
jgi:DNA-binding HxlR family transcriptional regulator